MSGKRLERVAQLIKQSLGNSVLTKIRDPRLGFVTITKVEVSSDLVHAKVFFTVLGDKKVQKSTAVALNHSRGFLQKVIATELKLRITPRLSFHYDSSLDYSFHIENILKKIHDDT
jgi:ribosome-binding factor A